MSRASKTIVIAVREYWAMVATKGFVISLLFAPAMGLLAWWFAQEELAGEQEPMTIAVVDRSRVIAPRLQQAAAARAITLESLPSDFDEAGVLQLAPRVRRGELAAIVEIGPDVATLDAEPPNAAQVVLYADNIVGARARLIRNYLTDAIMLERLRAAGIPELRAGELLREVGVDMRAVPTEGEDDKTFAERLLTPLLTGVFVFLTIMSAATPLLQAIVEEKQQRISEVLLGAVSPVQLMSGKLLGAIAVAFTTLLVYIVSGYAILAYLGYTSYVAVGSVALALPIAAIAALMYGSIFLALGAAVNDMKDAQSGLMPVMLLLMAPLMLMSIILDNPNGTVATVASLIPFTAPIIMPMRLGLSEGVPMWQPVLALILVLLTTAAIVWAAGRIFRIGILSQGKIPNAVELWRWIRHG